MSRNHLPWVASLIGLCSMSATAQTWQPAPSFPAGGRTSGAAITHAAGILVLGGTPWVNGSDMDGSASMLALGATEWQPLPPMAGMGPVVGHGAGVDALGRIVVFGGENIDNGDRSPTKVYTLEDGPTTSLASRPTVAPTQFFAWCTDGQGRLYTLGGGKGPEAVDEPGARNEAVCWRYVASTNTWQSIAPMPHGIGDACAVYDGNGHILVIGGVVATGGARSPNVARYDVASNTWSDIAIPDMPVAVNGAHAAVGANGWIYVTGGETGPLLEPLALDTTWTYRPDLNQWMAGPVMAHARRRHAAALGSDNYLYAIGGEDDNGPLSTCEKLYTPPCPTLTTPLLDAMPWARGSIALTTDASGGTPMTFHWTKDGVILTDGVTPAGSVISGATTTTLNISNLSTADDGLYHAEATNACGSASSQDVAVAVRVPPAIPTRWSVRTIHPAWLAGPSQAHSIANGRVVGATNVPTTLPDGRIMNLDHPLVWDPDTLQAIDITPAGSIGGAIYDVAGDLMTGWFWHIYSCYAGGQWWTCGWQSAGYWNISTGQFHEVHVSGSEFDAVYATDGVRMVGSATSDGSGGVHYSSAVVWSPPNYSPFSIQTPGTSQSFISAVDGDRLYGGVYTPVPGPIAHAGLWTGAAYTFTDLHPAGYASSSVSDARDGQAVGAAHIGGNSHAGIWIGTAFQDINPPGSPSSSMTAVQGGVQLGSAFGGPGLWNGSADSFFSLDSFVPPGYSSPVATRFEIAPDGAMTVVGFGWNAATARNEALLWRSLADCPADFNSDGVATSQDFFDFIVAFFAGAADFNRDGSTTSQDFFDFISAFFTPC